jgi:hypothetical protein
VVGWDVLLQQEAQAVDTLEAVLAVFDDELLSQEDNEVLEAAIANSIILQFFCPIFKGGSNG